MATPGSKLRDLIDGPGLVEAIGVHDALTARLVEMMGFACVYAGGAAAGISEFAMPDLGMITMTELGDHYDRVSAAVAIP